MIYIAPPLKAYFSTSSDLFDQVMALRGQVYRELENRRTQRVMLGEQAYFVKQHFGVGWKEIFKNLFQLKLPVLGAKNEWYAIRRLQKLHVLTQEIVGYGRRGCNPAKQQSFLITRELPKNVSLEDFCRSWPNERPSFSVKQTIIREVARIARTLHENGMNHRDFYICHFLLDLEKYTNGLILLYLIDLHRAQLRKQTPERWVIKDLAGLYFSSLDIGLTQRDRLRFIKEYRKNSLGFVFNKEAAFWQRVKTRGDQLYRQHAR